MGLETLGERVRYARDLLGIDQGELARRAKMKQTTLSKIETNGTGKSGDTPMLAHVLGVECLWLALGIDPMRRPAGDTVRMDRNPDEPQDVELHQYADPRCPHGPNYGRDDRPHLPVVHVPANVFAELGRDESQFFGFVAADDSMRDALPRGGRGAVDTRYRDPVAKSGAIYALEVNGEAMVRMISASSTGSYRISSSTSDPAFPDEIVDRDAVKVIGRVRWRGLID